MGSEEECEKGEEEEDQQRDTGKDHLVEHVGHDSRYLPAPDPQPKLPT
jgi:hypothetical protein